MKVSISARKSLSVNLISEFSADSWISKSSKDFLVFARKLRKKFNIVLNCTYYLLTCRINIFNDFVFIKDQFFPFLLNDLGNRNTKIEVNVQWREYYLIITLSVKWWRVESKRVCSRPIAVKGNRILFASQGLVVLSEMICVILWLDCKKKNGCSETISNNHLNSIKFHQ